MNGDEGRGKQQIRRVGRETGKTGRSSDGYDWWEEQQQGLVESSYWGRGVIMG